MTFSRSNLLWAFCVAAMAFAVDQGSKLYVMKVLALAPGQVHPVAPPYLQFVMSWNYGVNFGLFANHADWARMALAGFAVLVSVALAVWAARRWRDTPFAIGVGLVIGGAIGNAYDRMAYGAVADFLNMSCCGITNPFAFNIADIAIFAGVALLLLATARDDKRASEDGETGRANHDG